MHSNARILLYFMLAAVLLIVGITLRLPQLLEGPAPQGNSQMAIGGPFELVDHKGNTITDEDLRGSYSIIYFGYTFCPDVCPTGLQTITNALEMIPMRKSNKIIPVFITVDPERDTPEIMGKYVKHFHPNLVGLTGNSEQVKEVTKAYKIYYKKVVEEGKPEDEYLMDHSAFQYLMGPDGQYLTHFSHGVTAVEMAEKLKKYVR